LRVIFYSLPARVLHVTQEIADAIEIESIRKIGADRPAIAVEFFGETAAFILAEEDVILVPVKGDECRLRLHGGAILSSVMNGRRLLTGGDDGCIVAVDEAGATECIFTDGKARWIDCLAASRSSSLAWSAGKQVYCRNAGGSEKIVQVPSSVGGLAFAPDESLLAIAHYNGVTLCELQNDYRLSELNWKGFHLDVTFSPDGQVLVTTMREPTLHAWQLADKKDVPMPGYPARVRSLGWTASGRFLATSGTDRLALLTFQMKDNPLSRMPLLLAPYSRLVAAVACHPNKEIAAVGYEDGLVLLVRIPDGAEIMVKAPDESTIAAMRWNAAGKWLGIASDSGQCRVISIK
jgi:WD40 repeat protein